MKTKILMFCMFAATTIFAANAFTGNNVAEKAETPQVDQQIDPRFGNYILFDNQTGIGQSGNLQVDYATMNMAFGAAASDWLYKSRMPGKYTDYKFYNSQGKLLDFNQKCSVQGVYSGSVVTVRK